MAKRIIQPVELGDHERRIVKDLQKMHLKVAKRKMSVADIIRRSVRFAGQKFLAGEAPLIEEVTIGGGSGGKR